MSEELPTPEELREAEALARALEGEGPQDMADDARQAAALLRYVQRPELDAQRAEELRASLLKSQARRTRVVWVAGPLAAAVALFVIYVTASTPQRKAMHTADADEPLAAPNAAFTARAELLAAQARALRGDDADLSLLSEASGAYRKQWLASLDEPRGESP